MRSKVKIFSEQDGNSQTIRFFEIRKTLSEEKRARLKQKELIKRILKANKNKELE